MLDAAQRRWPEVHDRKQLLLRLTEAGSAAIAAEQRGQRRIRQHEALGRAGELVDVERLLDDSAWR